MSEKTPGFLNIEDGEDDVGTEVKARQRAKELRALSPSKRSKAKSDAKRVTGTWDLPRPVIEQLRAVSKKESISQANLVSHMLIEWISRYKAGEIDIEGTRSPAEGGAILRYRWQLPLIVPDDWDDA